jgi:transcriptional regulator with XRE-family HTH domain
MMTFGEYLRSARKKAGITATLIAKMLEWSNSYQCNIELGRKSPPDASKCNEIAGIFDINPMELSLRAAIYKGYLPEMDDEKITAFATEVFLNTTQDPAAYKIVNILSKYAYAYEGGIAEDGTHQFMTLTLRIPVDEGPGLIPDGPYRDDMIFVLHCAMDWAHGNAARRRAAAEGE